MGIYKIIDIVGASEDGFCTAAKNAVVEAAKTVYRAEMKIAFEIER